MLLGRVLGMLLGRVLGLLVGWVLGMLVGRVLGGAAGTGAGRSWWLHMALASSLPRRWLQSRPSTLSASLLVLAGSKAGGRFVSHSTAGISFLLSSSPCFFNEPTLEDLERRSRSFAVTYLPASAPYSAEGINLGSRHAAGVLSPSRRAVQAS